jgi:hypothetical protein
MLAQPAAVSRQRVMHFGLDSDRHLRIESF